MTKRPPTSLSVLLEEIERLLLSGPLDADVQRQCVRVLSTALQNVAHTTAHAFPGDEMQEIRGNTHVKRALEVAAAGGHHILLYGPHQAGKTQLARSLPSILPGAAASSPFRSPDASIKRPAFVGEPTMPGELTLAHTGVLLLDDLHRFDTALLAAVRQAVATHVVTVPNGKEDIQFPARFLLVATTRSCPCGWYGDSFHDCGCAVEAIVAHRRRTRPLVDACIDIFVEVPRVQQDLLSRYTEESSTQIRGRVEQARARQDHRYAAMATARLNADLRSVEEVQRHCVLDSTADKLLRAAIRQLRPSPPAILRMQQVARTIADLAGSEYILAQHLAEAIQYQPRKW